MQCSGLCSNMVFYDGDAVQYSLNEQQGVVSGGRSHCAMCGRYGSSQKSMTLRVYSTVDAFIRESLCFLRVLCTYCTYVYILTLFYVFCASVSRCCASSSRVRVGLLLLIRCTVR